MSKRKRSTDFAPPPPPRRRTHTPVDRRARLWVGYEPLHEASYTHGSILGHDDGSSRTVQLLRRTFEVYGSIRFVQQHRGTDGFLELCFDRVEDAVKARTNLHLSTLEKRDLFVLPYLDEPKLWVGDLQPTVTEKLLRAALGQFGDVNRVTIARQTVDKKPMGHACVEFKRRRVAAQVQLLCNRNLFLFHSTRPLRVESFDARRHVETGVVVKDKVRGTWISPHLAQPNTLEYELASEWRDLQLYQRQVRRQLHKEQKAARDRLWEKQAQRVSKESRKLAMLDETRQSIKVINRGSSRR